MKKCILVFLICLINISAFSQKEPEHFTFPAEFEKQDAVWMGLRSTITGRGLDKSEDLLRIIKAVTPFVKVNLFIGHDTIRNVLQKEFEKRGIDKNKVQMFVYANPYSNVRDPGPVFLKSDKGNLMIADMKWNFYGTTSSTSPAAIRVDTLDQFVAREFSLPIRTSNIVRRLHTNARWSLNIKNTNYMWLQFLNSHTIPLTKNTNAAREVITATTHKKRLEATMEIAEIAIAI